MRQGTKRRGLANLSLMMMTTNDHLETDHERFRDHCRICARPDARGGDRGGSRLADSEFAAWARRLASGRAFELAELMTPPPLPPRRVPEPEHALGRNGPRRISAARLFEAPADA